MNKEEIMVMNKKLNNFEHDYIATKEENTNLKQALNEIREVLKRFECSLWIETDALRKEVEKIIYEYTKED